jgi:predicted DNA-binding mobile mystery protein A
MSATDLANRLEVSPAAVAKLEEGERRGATRLETLERAANAMDCDLVYALVPRESLEYTVRERARHVALNDFAALSHSMDLENQRLDTDASKDALESLIERALATRGLWKRERD